MEAHSHAEGRFYAWSLEAHLPLNMVICSSRSSDNAHNKSEPTNNWHKKELRICSGNRFHQNCHWCHHPPKYTKKGMFCLQNLKYLWFWNTWKLVQWCANTFPISPHAIHCTPFVYKQWLKRWCLTGCSWCSTLQGKTSCWFWSISKVKIHSEMRKKNLSRKLKNTSH